MAADVTQELELLKKLLGLYKKRYTGKELEKKFNDACEDLMNTCDINRKTYLRFCVEEDIEPKVVKKSSSSGSGGGYGCGHSLVARGC